MMRQLTLSLLLTVVIFAQAQNSPGKKESAAPVYRKSARATEPLKALNSDAILWLDPAKWKHSGTEGIRMTLQATDGAGFGFVVSEPVGGIPTDAMEEAILVNARRMDPDASLVRKELRQVNGRQILYLEYKATVNKIPLYLWNYAFGGEKSNLQVICTTVQSSAAGRAADCIEMLNGLQVSEGEAQGSAPAASGGAATHVLIEGNAEIRHGADWRVTSPATEAASPVLQHRSGAVYAKLVAEGIAIPLEGLIEVATDNLKKAADTPPTIEPLATSILGGLEMQCRKAALTAKKIPLRYLSCFYADAKGAFQLHGWTTAAQFEEHEGEIFQLFDGFKLKR